MYKRQLQYILEAEQGDEDAPEDAPPAEPIIVAETPTQVESMTVGEATMRLDLAGLPALLFRNAKHGGLNMVYQRADGNYGWVDPKLIPGESGASD